MKTQNSAVAAIQFALSTDEGIEFLRCWNQGDFDVIRREWPEAPEEVFIGEVVQIAEIEGGIGREVEDTHETPGN